MSEINNTQIDNAKDIDLLIPMYNLIELNPHNLQNNYYLKIIENHQNIYGNTTEMNQFWLMLELLLIFLLLIITVFCLNLSKKITGKTGNDDFKKVDIMLPYI